MRPFAVLLLAAWMAACASQPLDEAALREKESMLNKLAAYVESAVRFQDAPASLSEAELLEFATRQDRAPLESFRGYLLRVRREGALSSVLVCTADGSRALWEDAGCTPPLDARLWDRPAASCAFRLDLAQVCR